MAYRNGTYVAFHAEGQSNPTMSDFKYYGMMKAWNELYNVSFDMIDSHEKTDAVRDSSKRATLQARLRERLRNHSKNMVLLIGDKTRFDTDWVPMEIEYAIDTCGLPIIVTYVEIGYRILNPQGLSHLWPASLKTRIDKGTAHTIHIPFKRQPLADAIGQFGPEKFPNGTCSYYRADVYDGWGIK